jgi:hypothetical protein
VPTLRRMHWSAALRCWTALVVAPLIGCSQGSFAAALNELRGEQYPLDAIQRETTPGAACPEVELVLHRGSELPFQPSVRVTPPFVERLARFEQIAIQVARESYGRAPRSIRHAGAYVCRPIRKQGQRWSEHALGNAIDVVGFDFARADRSPSADAGLSSPPVLPPALRRAFEVRVVKHWNAPATDAAAELHQRFLHRLVAALREHEIFRAMIGPPDPDHRTHLHLDMGPWRYERL